LRVRIIRSHGLVPLRFSRFVVLFFCRLHVFAWLSGYEKSNQDRSLRAPVKGDANIAIRNEFRRCAPELSSVSPQCRLSRRSKKRTSCFRLPQFPTASPAFVSERKELTPDLPRRAVAPAHAFCAPLFVGVVVSRFAFRGLSPFRFRPWKRASTVNHRLLQLILDARARPELLLPPPLTTTFLADRRLVFHRDEPRASVPAVRDRSPTLRRVLSFS
jgi:hypothetical protein